MEYTSNSSTVLKSSNENCQKVQEKNLSELLERIQEKGYMYGDLVQRLYNTTSRLENHPPVQSNPKNEQKEDTSSPTAMQKLFRISDGLSECNDHLSRILDHLNSLV